MFRFHLQIASHTTVEITAPPTGVLLDLTPSGPRARLWWERDALSGPDGEILQQVAPGGDILYVTRELQLHPQPQRIFRGIVNEYQAGGGVVQLQALQPREGDYTIAVEGTPEPPLGHGPVYRRVPSPVSEDGALNGL